MKSLKKPVLPLVSKASLFFSIGASFFLTLGSVHAQNYVDNTSNNLASAASWTLGHVPTTSEVAEWSSSQIGSLGYSNSPLQPEFTTSGNVSWGSIYLSLWSDGVTGLPQAVDLNTITSGPTADSTDVITLMSSTSLTDSNVAFDVSNLKIGTTAQSWSISAATLLIPLVNITSTLTESTSGSTLNLSGGSLLGLVGSSNSPTHNTPNAASGQLNLELDGTNIAFGNNGTNNFGSLILNNGVTSAIGRQTITLGTAGQPGVTMNTSGKRSSYVPGITAVTDEFFNDGTNPTNPAAKVSSFDPGANILTVYGWQGAIGDISSQQPTGTGSRGTYGRLLFQSDLITTPVDTIVFDVVFDLSENAYGATSTTTLASGGTGYTIPNFTGEGLTATQDYGEWIASGITGYYELVPYWGPVPEPSTIIGGLVLLGALFWRERRRLAPLYAHFLPSAERTSSL